jgi:hypothetical protein
VSASRPILHSGSNRSVIFDIVQVVVYQSNSFQWATTSQATTGTIPSARMAHSQVAIPDSTGAMTQILMYEFLFLFVIYCFANRMSLLLLCVFHVFFSHQVWWLEWVNLADLG